jgi:hypothetical protein
MRRILVPGILLVLLSAAACGRPEQRPAPPGQARGDGTCTLPLSGHASLDEWGSCVQVTAALSRPPAVGEEAVLTVEVLAAQDRQVRLELDLPRTFAWVQVPAGLAQVRLPDPAPDTGGCVNRATDQVRLTAGQPTRLTGTVRATAPGFATLRARAVTVASPSSGGVSGGADRGGGTGADSVFVTVGQSPQTSFFGYRPGAGASAATTAGPIRVGCD